MRVGGGSLLNPRLYFCRSLRVNVKTIMVLAEPIPSLQSLASPPSLCKKEVGPYGDCLQWHTHVEENRVKIVIVLELASAP